MKWKATIECVDYVWEPGVTEEVCDALHAKWGGTQHEVECDEDSIEDVLKDIIESDVHFKVEEVEYTYTPADGGLEHATCEDCGEGIAECSC